MRKQRGFTLIELIIVIVILGILAAFAIPRFIDLARQARISAVLGVEGSVRSAAAIAHSACLVNANGTSSCSSNAAGGTVNMEGVSVAMNYAYPQNVAGGIANAIGGIPAGFNLVSGSFQKIGATTESTCSVTYVEAGANGSPTITNNIGGC